MAEPASGTNTVFGTSLSIVPPADRMGITQAPIERSLRPIPETPPRRARAQDVPYFEAHDLRRLAALARHFAELLPPEDRGRLLASAARLERDAARQEAS
jgi:hypothetical protein